LSERASAKFTETFCQVHFFSAKFVACLPSLVQTLQSFCQVFGVSAKLSWQKIANSNELAENCQLGATQYKIHEFHRERVQQFRVGNFLPTRSSWQKAQNLAERPRTWQKRNEKAETGEAPCTEWYQGIDPATYFFLTTEKKNDTSHTQQHNNNKHNNNNNHNNNNIIPSLPL
jgi:hypothetical protein